MAIPRIQKKTDNDQGDGILILFVAGSARQSDFA
jgi:hypothetical protein